MKLEEEEEEEELSWAWEKNNAHPMRVFVAEDEMMKMPDWREKKTKKERRRNYLSISECQNQWLNASLKPEDGKETERESGEGKGRSDWIFVGSGTARVL